MNNRPPSALSPTQFYILLALAQRPTHGYGLIWQCRQESGGAVAMSSATLYGILKSLLADGLIESAGAAPAERSGNERKLYRLSPIGRVVLAEELQRLDRAVETGRERLRFQD